MSTIHLEPPRDDSAPKPSNPPTGHDAKPSPDKLKSTTDDGGSTNKPSSGGSNSDKIHISFDGLEVDSSLKILIFSILGISTVNDLLDRIDEAIERSKIVVESGGDKGQIGLKINDKLSPPKPSSADLEKKPLKKAEDDQKKEGDQKQEQKKGEEEPIRIKHNEIHKVEDLLQVLNNASGNRKIVLDDAHDNTDSGTAQKQINPPPTTAPRSSTGLHDKDMSSTTTNENDDPSAPPKSILKTSQNPSSLDTSTRTSSLQDDQIHVNIEGIASVDELLDRIDDAVEHTPVVIDEKPQGEKRQGLFFIIYYSSLMSSVFMDSSSSTK